MSRNKILLAEKVETREDFRIAVEMGFSLFQGYFFSKPSIIAGVPDKKNNHFIHQQVLNNFKKKILPTKSWKESSVRMPSSPTGSCGQPALAARSAP